MTVAQVPQEKSQDRLPRHSLKVQSEIGYHQAVARHQANRSSSLVFKPEI